MIWNAQLTIRCGLLVPWTQLQGGGCNRQYLAAANEVVDCVLTTQITPNEARGVVAMTAEELGAYHREQIGLYGRNDHEQQCRSSADFFHLLLAIRITVFGHVTYAHKFDDPFAMDIEEARYRLRALRTIQAAVRSTREADLVASLQDLKRRSLASAATTDMARLVLLAGDQDEFIRRTTARAKAIAAIDHQVMLGLPAPTPAPARSTHRRWTRPARS